MIERFESPYSIPAFGSAYDLAQVLLTHVAPHEVVALDDHLDVLVERGDRHPNPTDDLLGQLPSAREMIASLNVDYTYAMYSAYTQSQRIINRQSAALEIPLLTRVDHDRGMELWDQLARDSDIMARYHALEHFGDYLKAFSVGHFEAADEDLAYLGVTREDYLQLAAGYEAAERGERLHDVPVELSLGEVVLGRIVKATTNGK